MKKRYSRSVSKKDGLGQGFAIPMGRIIAILVIVTSELQCFMAVITNDLYGTIFVSHYMDPKFFASVVALPVPRLCHLPTEIKIQSNNFFFMGCI